MSCTFRYIVLVVLCIVIVSLCLSQYPLSRMDGLVEVRRVVVPVVLVIHAYVDMAFVTAMCTDVAHPPDVCIVITPPGIALSSSYMGCPRCVLSMGHRLWWCVGCVSDVCNVVVFCVGVSCPFVSDCSAACSGRMLDGVVPTALDGVDSLGGCAGHTPSVSHHHVKLLHVAVQMYSL